ncbi:MAG: hypothetical protein NTU53_09505 [Planctomycetota bacterium]|nr:hypothetical protein [Planctomycetota bacterium]
MANILLAWELGGGLGHIMQLLPLAEGLAKRGHRVFAALKDLSHAKAVFGNTVSCLQAPMRTRSVPDRFRPPVTFGHILHGVGFGDAREMTALGEAWRNLYEFTRPEVIIFDHSPTALLAARGFSAKRITIGSGFCCPPDTHPLANLRPWLASDSERLRQDEDRILANSNEALGDWGQEPLDHIGQIYSEVDECFLVTFKELDHFPGRGEARYWGAWTQGGGKSPEWPKGGGRKIFGYLKPNPAMPQILKSLSDLGHSTIIFVDGVPAKAQQQYSTATLRLECQPLDLKQVGRQCDVAILNAGHGGTVSMLMAGKPVLQLPIYLEQGLLARAVCQMGAGQEASLKRPETITQKLQIMLRTDQYQEAAEAFSTRYADFQAQGQIDAMLGRVEELARR